MSAVPLVGSPSSSRRQSQWRYFSFVQAGAAAVAIFFNVTTGWEDLGWITVCVLAVLLTIAYLKWPDHPFRYRIFSAFALLGAYLASFLPAFFVAEPVGAATALILVAFGSLPSWALAVWVLDRRTQEPSTSTA